MLILTSKNSAKLKQYYYFHAEFLEVRYDNLITKILHKNTSLKYGSYIQKYYIAAKNGHTL